MLASGVVYRGFGGWANGFVSSSVLETYVDSKRTCWLCSERIFVALPLLGARESRLVGLPSDADGEPGPESTVETKASLCRNGTFIRLNPIKGASPHDSFNNRIINI